MSSFCPLQTDFIEDPPFDRVPFENTAAILWMHDSPPRFGHTRDLNKLIMGSEEDGEDYVLGLVAGSIAMFCFFFVWICLLIVFKCCCGGPRRVGFWSGSMIPLNPEPVPPEAPLAVSGGHSFGTEACGDDPSLGEQQQHYTPEDKAYQEYEKYHELWEIKKKEANRQLDIIRVIVLFAGASIIVSSGLMIGKGVSGLVDTLDSGRDSLGIVSNLTDIGIIYVDNMIQTQRDAEEDTRLLLESLNTFCPKVREALCDNIFNATGCDLEGVPYADEVQIILDAFDGTRARLRGLFFDDIIRLREDLVTLNEAASDLDKKAATFNWAFWVAAAFAIMLAVLCSIMMIGVVLAWCHSIPTVFYCCRMLVMVPLYTLLVSVAWIFSMVFVIGSMALADTCIDSPDQKVLYLIDKLKGEISSVVASLLVFYVTGCPKDKAPTELGSYISKITDALPGLEQVFRTFRASSAEIKNACGDSPTLLTAAGDSVTDLLCRVAELLVDVRDFFSCDNWYPLYETVTYETMCYSGTEGFAWVASTQFVIVFMTMIILTLRMAFYEIEVLEPAIEDDDISEEGEMKQPLELFPPEEPSESLLDVQLRSDDDTSPPEEKPHVQPSDSEADALFVD